MEKEMLARLQEKSGGGENIAPRIPTMKLDGSGTGDTAGNFLLFDNDNMVSLGNEIVLRIIKIRKKLLLGNDEEKYFSGQYDDAASDKVTLYRQKYGEKERSVVMEGTPNEIRAVHPVKVVSVVYAIYDGKLVKLNVKGSSCSGDDGLYAYTDMIKDSGLGLFQVETLISVSKVQKNRAITYHRAHFNKGDELTTGFDLVEKYLDIVNGNEVKDTKQAVDAEIVDDLSAF